MIDKYKLALLLALIGTSALAQMEMKLSLQEALKTAVERNLDLELQRLNVNTSNLDIESTRTRYEPQVTAGISTRESKAQASNNNEGTSTTVITSTGSDVSTALSKQEWWGMSWRLSTQTNLNESNSQNSLGERYNTSLSLGFEQELLKGFSRDKELLLYDQYVAISNSSITRVVLEDAIITVLQTTENAYWDLVLAREQLQVNIASLELAETFLEQNKTKVDVGTLPPIDLVNAETQVASREREIVTAENQVSAAEDALKKVMNLPLEKWAAIISPTDQIIIEAVETHFEEDLATALSNRTEMRKHDQNLRKAELGVKLRQDEMQAKLTFGGSYGFNGASIGEPIRQRLINPVTGEPIQDANGNDLFTTVGTTGTSVRNSYTDTLAREKPSWNASLNLTWNPFNKAGKINLTKANIEMRREELFVEQTKVTILEDVRSSVREIHANKKSIQASEKSVKLSRENLKAAEQKFQNGIDTNYTVAEKQKDLVQEETSLIQAQINYIKAVTSYHKALGKLLEKRNILVQ